MFHHRFVKQQEALGFSLIFLIYRFVEGFSLPLLCRLSVLGGFLLPLLLLFYRSSEAFSFPLLHRFTVLQRLLSLPLFLFISFMNASLLSGNRVTQSLLPVRRATWVGRRNEAFVTDTSSIWAMSMTSGRDRRPLSMWRVPSSVMTYVVWMARSMATRAVMARHVPMMAHAPVCCQKQAKAQMACNAMAVMSWGLGQKNTAFAIWIASAYLNPLSTVGPGCYILWQNIIDTSAALSMRGKQTGTKRAVMKLERKV